MHPLIVGTLARDRIDRLMQVGAAERRSAPSRVSRRPGRRRLGPGARLVSAVRLIWDA